MKNAILSLSLMITFFAGYAQTINSDAVVGTWLTASGKAKVTIYKVGSKYNGKISWLKNPNYEDGTTKRDKNNPDKNRQSDPLLGLLMLKDFEFDEDEWENGTIYDPENGKTYSCTMKMRDGKLDLRGYIGISLIGRTQTWFRVADIK